MSFGKLVSTAVLAAAALPQAGLAAVAAEGTLDACIKRWIPATSGSFDTAKLNELRGICVDIVGDEQRLATMRVTSRIYEGQIAQSRVLLVIVVFITLTGLALSALQLLASYKLASAGKGALAEGGDISLETGRIAVKSSVVGVVILGISLAFFAIFVSQVYRISPDSDLSPASLSGGAPGPPPGKEVAK